MLLVIAYTIFHFLPLGNYPRLKTEASLRTLIGIPTQIYLIYYVQGCVRKVKIGLLIIFVNVISLLYVLQTLYMICIDVYKIALIVNGDVPISQQNRL